MIIQPNKINIPKLYKIQKQKSDRKTLDILKNLILNYLKILKILLLIKILHFQALKIFSRKQKIKRTYFKKTKNQNNKMSLFKRKIPNPNPKILKIKLNTNLKIKIVIILIKISLFNLKITIILKLTIIKQNIKMNIN